MAENVPPVMAGNVPPGSSKGNGGNDGNDGNGGKKAVSLPIRQQPAQRLPSTATDGLWVSLGRDIGWSVLQRVSKRGGNFVRASRKDLDQLGIQSSGMDLNGKPADGTQPFFSPLSKAAINRYDKEYGLSTMDRLPNVERGSKGNWDWAFWLVTYFECCLNPEHLEIGDESALDKSVWEMRMYDRLEKIRYECKYNIDNCWNAFFILYNKTGRTPHLLAVIGENNHLTQDTVNESELYALTKLCTAGHCREEHKAHKIIPVAAITISCQQLRIVQGYADPKTGKFRVQVGPLLADDGTSDRWNIHGLVLAWLLSEPVGQTT